MNIIFFSPPYNNFSKFLIMSYQNYSNTKFILYRERLVTTFVTNDYLRTCWKRSTKKSTLNMGECEKFSYEMFENFK